MTLTQSLLDFDGNTYVPDRDKIRLNVQLRAIFNVLADGHWHTLAQLEAITGYPQASVSARIRDLRKPRFGAFEVKREYVTKGLWRYRLEREDDGRRDKQEAA